MMGGVNVAAVVAIPVVLVLLLLVIGVVVGVGCYYLCYHKQGLLLVTDLAKIIIIATYLIDFLYVYSSGYTSLCIPCTHMYNVYRFIVMTY